MRTINKINLLLAGVAAVMVLGSTATRADRQAMPMDTAKVDRLEEKYEVEVVFGTWVDDEDSGTMFIPDVPTVHFDFVPDSPQVKRHFDFIPDSTAN